MSTELSELFDRDPLKLSEQDITVIVEAQRAAQSRHELGVRPPTKKAAAPNKAATLLKDLGL